MASRERWFTFGKVPLTSVFSAWNLCRWGDLNPHSSTIGIPGGVRSDTFGSVWTLSGKTLYGSVAHLWQRATRIATIRHQIC